MAPHSKSPTRSGGKRGSSGADVLALQRALYALPLDAFTRARDALAKELASKGQAKDAQATKKLKRPVLAAWVVNQLAHHHAQNVEELLSSARALEKAHRKAISGGGSEALKEANRAFQRAVDALMADSNALLAATQRAAAGDLIRQVDETLRAAALGAEEDRTALAQGMLTRPLQHSSFGPFSQLLVVGADARARPQPRPPAAQVSHRPSAKAPEPASAGGKLLQGPWAPRHGAREAAPPAPPPPPKRQARVEPDTRARRAQEAKQDQRRREAELEQRRREAEERAELSKLRREARQQAVQAEKTQRRARREVELQEATLRVTEAKSKRARTVLEDAEAKVLRAREVLEELEAQALHAREALERLEQAAQQQTEAISQANAQAQAAEQTLAQVRSLLEEADSRLSR